MKFLFIPYAIPQIPLDVSTNLVILTGISDKGGIEWGVIESGFIVCEPTTERLDFSCNWKVINF